ncbi:MAG: serine hydrolase domain-containing protein [Parvularculaceae bacterium]|nr:serine hydrolase domain-containing protein [Parvularculaceae bacterium]
MKRKFVVSLLAALSVAGAAYAQSETAPPVPPEVDVTLPERPDPDPPRLTEPLAPATPETLAPPPVPRRLHAGGAGAASLSDPSSIEPFLDGYVANAMADQYPPGMMVAVATRDGVFVKTYGLADAENNIRASDTTLFRIASISKTFVWTAVMMLVDEGKIDLDADVDTYLKTVKVGQRGEPPVTMRDLMAHRPGFEDTFGDFFQSKSGRNFEEALERTKPARVARPGERTSYSNWGTDLAAQVVADVSGEPFDRFVAARLLQPIGMVSTIQHDPAPIAATALNDPALDARLAAPHKLDGGAPAVMTHDALDPLHAAGAIAFDAHDAGRWLQFLLKGGVAGDKRLLSPEAFARMRTRSFRDRPFSPDFAHGFMETEIGGAITFGHGGTLSGFISDMTIAPSLGVGVFVAVNGAEAPRLPDLVSRYVIEQFARADSYPAAWPVKATPEMIAKAKSAAGAYLPNRRVWSRFEKVTALGSEIKLAAKDDGSLVVTAGGKATRYYPLSDDLWSNRSRDRLFVYRDSAGAPVRIATAMGTMTADRVSFLNSSDAFNAAIGFVSVFSLLAFLGAWRRQGRDVETTRLGKWLAGGHAATAFLWLAFVGSLTVVSALLGEKELADLQAVGWPPVPLIVAIVVAHLAAIAALAAAIGVFPVLVGSGWSLWRRAHYILFAAAGLFAVWQLVAWKVILAAPSG